MLRIWMASIIILAAGCAPALSYRAQPSDPPGSRAKWDADLAACGGNPPTLIAAPLVLAPILLIQAVQTERTMACLRTRGWRFPLPDPDPVLESLPSRSR